MIEELIQEFNGAIKYTPMLKDHPDWTKAQCVAFAKLHHASAIAGLREFGKDGPWNNGIPYCRNIPTVAMLKEANA